MFFFRIFFGLKNQDQVGHHCDVKRKSYIYFFKLKKKQQKSWPCKIIQTPALILCRTTFNCNCFRWDYGRKFLGYGLWAAQDHWDWMASVCEQHFSDLSTHSIGFGTGLWLGHSNTWICFVLNHSGVDFAEEKQLQTVMLPPPCFGDCVFRVMCSVNFYLYMKPNVLHFAQKGQLFHMFGVSCLPCAILIFLETSPLQYLGIPCYVPWSSWCYLLHFKQISETVTAGAFILRLVTLKP